MVDGKERSEHALQLVSKICLRTVETCVEIQYLQPRNQAQDIQKQRPTRAYGAECWRMTAKDLSRLSTFHTTCLRRIMRVFWPNRISNSDLLEATKQEPMNNILKRRRWRWIGHTLRMEPSAHARIALTWTPEGRRKRWHPRSTGMLGELKEAGMVWSAAVKRAQDGDERRNLVEALCATWHKEDE